MYKAVFVLCTVAMLALAPSALACADCIYITETSPRPNCVWPGPAQYCWEEWQTPEGPGGCYTTGRCPGGGGGLALVQLGSELAIASVEIRQDNSTTTTNLLPVVAELPRRQADAR